MKITKLSDGTFSVRTAKILSDGSELSAHCYLDGNVLRTVYERAHIVLTPVTVKLGPVSLTAIQALAIGESFESK